MLTINKLKNKKAHSNYTYNTRSRYYYLGGEPPGTWYGKGLQYVDLKNGSEIKKKEFENIFNGYSKTGGPLVKNEIISERNKAWEITFSVPRTLSAYWSCANDRERQKIEKSAFEAVQDAIKYIERNCAYSNKRTPYGDLTHSRAELIFGIFEKSQNLRQLPNLHHHVLVMNLGFERRDRKPHPVSADEIRKHKKAIEKVYLVSLAHQLNNVLNETIIPTKKGFEITGVSDRVANFLSPYGECIVPHHERRFYEPVSRVYSAHSKREYGLSRADLFRSCKYIKNQIEAIPEYDSANDIGRRYSIESENRNLQAIVRAEIARLANEQLIFTKRDIIERCAHYAIKTGKGIDELTNNIKNELSSRCAQLSIINNEIYYTATAQENAEIKIEDILYNRPRTERHVVHQPNVSEFNQNNIYLTDNQKAVVESIATQNEHFSYFPADAEKDRSLIIKSLSDIYKNAHYNVVGVAPDEDIAKSLSEKTGIPFQTIDKFITNSQVFTTNPKKDTAQWKLSQQTWNELNKIIPQRKDTTTSTVVNVEGNRTIKEGSLGKELDPKAYLAKTTFALGAIKIEEWKTPRERTRLHPQGPINYPQDYLRIRGEQTQILGERTVLFVDQIERINARKQAAILERAEAVGLKLVLSGKDNQKYLQPKEASSMVNRIRHRLFSPSATTEDEERSQESRTLVKNLQNGSAERIIEDLKAKGRYHESTDMLSTKKKVIDLWREGKGPDHETVVIAPNSEESISINSAIQQARSRLFEIGPGKIELTLCHLYEGDRVRFAATSAVHNIKNGELGTITKISRSDLTVRTDDGRDKRISIREYNKLELGYAVTPQQAEQTTIKNAIVIFGQNSKNREKAIRQLPNIKKEVHIYAQSNKSGVNQEKLIREIEQAKGKRTIGEALLGVKEKLEEKQRDGNRKWTRKKEIESEQLRRDAEQIHQRQTNKVKLS
jgi:conjugative relaxase-like TrwC/TraI family protein